MYYLQNDFAQVLTTYYCKNRSLMIHSQPTILYSMLLRVLLLRVIKATHCKRFSTMTKEIYHVYLVVIHENTDT